MDTIIPQKFCFKCRKNKPVDVFPQHKRVNGVVGYSSPCKECRNVRSRERYHANTPKNIEIDLFTTKTCTKCHECKPIQEFPVRPSKLGGYAAMCKECTNEWRNAHRKATHISKPEIEMPLGVKKCIHCKEVKPTIDFAIRPGTKDKFLSWCRKCTNERNKKYAEYNYSRTVRLRNKYKMTNEEYNIMFLAQNGKCAACHNEESAIDPRTNRIKQLAVDHDHRTGRVRALLCQGCNLAFGWLRDSPERVEALLSYAYWCQSQDCSPTD